MGRGFRIVAMLVLAAPALGISGCHADSAAVYERQWLCDAKRAPEQCGTSESGAPLTCFGASAIGGKDFCTEACDPSVEGAPDPEATSVCLASGARVELCDPGGRATCPDGFECYRTDLLPIPARNGLCLMMPVCKDDSGCSDPARPTCATTILSVAYPGAPLAKDHLFCTSECQGDEDCPDDSVCTRTRYELTSVPPFCLPQCDSQNNCPPNFYCQRAGGPAYPPLCAPGVPLLRCAHDDDCLIGTCRDTHAGFSVCTLDCESDALCQALSGSVGHGFCSDGICITKTPFAGTLCGKAADCGDGVCSDFDPYRPGTPRDQKNRECHRTCEGPGGCETLGSVPYLCLPVNGQYGECYPADFGLACTSGVDACMGMLECLAPESLTGADASENEDTATCTLPCCKHSDCDAYALTTGAVCERGVCRPLADGETRDDDSQSSSGTCKMGQGRK